MRDAPLRICLVTREHPAFGTSGGIGTHTQHLARALAQRGHRVTVLAHGPRETASAEGVRLVGVGARHAWRAPWPARWLGMVARTGPFAVAAARALREEGPFDVLEVPEYQGWGLAAALATRTPVVARLHGHTALVRRLNGQALDLDARLAGLLEAATLRRASLVLASSASLAGAARQDFRPALPRERVAIVPLGVDTRHFRPVCAAATRARLRVPAEAPVLLYAGRLEARKGVWTLLEAFIQVLRRHPEALLVLAGGDPPGGPTLREALRARAAEAGVADHLRLPGHLTQAELPGLYAACDVFVAPSPAEPFGLVYLEAMACGRPVVGCHAGGAPEIVTEGVTGWLVPPNDAPGLAARLSAALTSRPQLMEIGQEARRVATERHSLDALAASTEAWYQVAVAGGRQARQAGAA
ncbi:MAG: glycosyltransferase family 4 protein [Candidatus Sericytochromatia bacterium]|nr:glycosyltransferase family 4 protein [Candidatus Sericytochromatia bacterium]